MIVWILTVHIVFAPIGVVIKYQTVEQAIEIANGTRYGLGASVFGPVKDECLKAAKRLQCGMVAINDFGVFYVSDIFPCWHRGSVSLTYASMLLYLYLKVEVRAACATCD